MVGCGCGSETSSPGGSRYFGDPPGQEATRARISHNDCVVLGKATEAEVRVALRTESEPSPPSSRCLLRGRGVRVSIYLDAAYAARQRYYNRIVEQVQFYGTDPAKRPHAVAGVGDRSAHEHTASWIPALSTLYAVRDNRWLTVSYSTPGSSLPRQRDAAAALARQAFSLTAG